jgi:hypothetical protein
VAKKNRTPKKQKPFPLYEWEAAVRDPRDPDDAQELRSMEAWTAVDWFEDVRRDRQPIGLLFERVEPGDPDPRKMDELMLGEVRELNHATLEIAGFTEEAIADSDAVLAEFEQVFSDCRRPDGSMDLAQITARCWLRWRIPEERLWRLTPEQIVMLDRESRATDQPTTDGQNDLPLADRRRAFITPLLAAKGLSDWDWMIAAKVDWKTVKRYLDGGKAYRSTRKKLAEPLGIDPESLP